MTFKSQYDEIEELIKENSGVVLFAEGVDREWIENAEAALGLKLPPSFVDFLLPSRRRNDRRRGRERFIRS